MDIVIKYNDSEIADRDISEITNLSSKYGNVDVKKYGGIRSSALDLVSILEFSIATGAGKIISDAYLKGLLGESYIKELGESTRGFILSSVSGIGNYISAFYKVFISKQRASQKAITFVEQFENYTIYVVLNDNKMTQTLADSVAQSLVKLYSFIALRRIETDTPKVLQLYPNYDTDRWDYVFAPTTQAYGKYIDRYFSLEDESFHYIDSVEEFINKFQITDFDEFKFIISAKYHLNS